MGQTQSHTKILNNGLPQGSVLAPILFNLYIADMPDTTSLKFAYADDLALATSRKTMEDTERILTNDLAILGAYYKKWRLTPNPNKTECICFHLNNKEATRQLNIQFDGHPVKHNPTPKYLGITLDRSLTYNSHLQKTAAKARTRNNIIQKLCGTTWGSTASTLRSAALGLVYSAAEYGAPIWLNSSHTDKLDVQLNSTMRTVTGCIKSTPTHWLPTLSHIPPPQLRRQEALIREYRKILHNEQLPIHNYIPAATSTRLKSRRPVIKTAKTLLDENLTIEQRWESSWNRAVPPEVSQYLNTHDKPAGFDLPRRIWKIANRIRTNHGLCRDSLHKWDKITDPLCDCGRDNQTIQHIVENCETTAYPGVMSDFLTLPHAAIQWIENLSIEI